VLRISSITVFLFITCSAFAQKAWESKIIAGFLVPHHEDMVQMMAPIRGFEISRSWKIDSAGSVAIKQNHPYCGIGVNYFNLGKSINGNAFTAFGYYDAGINLKSKTTLRGRFAFGVGYLTKQYNAFTNPLNRAIGSNINGFMQIYTYLQTPIGKYNDLQLGIGLSHFSNGNWSQPNLGINLPSVLLGIKARDKSTRYLNVLQIHKVPTNIQWEFSARLGKRQIGIDNPRNIVNYLVEATIIYPHNEFRQWRIGVVSFFDKTYVFTKFQPLPSKIRPDQITELAIQAGHEYRIGRVGLVTDLGFYIYRPDRSKRIYYEGIGLKLYVTDNLVLINRLKVHLTTADYFEWGLCYNITSSNRVNPGFVNGFKWVFRGFRNRHNNFF